MDEVMCKCTKETIIQEMKAEISLLRNNQGEDGKNLARFETKLDALSDSIKKRDEQYEKIIEGINTKLEKLMEQPADRYEKLKLVAMSTVITGIVAYIVSVIFTGVPQ